MRKTLLMAPLFVALLALMIAAPVKAVTVTVKTVDATTHTPRDTFVLGEKLCVYIHSSEDALGWIELYDSSGALIPGWFGPLTLTGCDDNYIYYDIPYDFPLGTYEVCVWLEGADPFWLSFTVILFFIIPELPLGTLMALVVPLAVVAGLKKGKRLRFIR